MSDSEVKGKLDYILINGDDFQRKVITKCVLAVHYEVSEKNEPKNRKNFADYKNRIEQVFTHGNNEQISSLVGSLLVQEHNVAINKTSL